MKITYTEERVMVSIFHRVFTDPNLTSFDLNLGHDKLKENRSRGKVYTHEYNIYIYILELQQAQR